ncbi:cohesin domain-containing protein [Natronorubrum halophilum]|uniref:cohesin domain-containing protein n=1 Tax=Natronorubrum halophilum TaxID=1702106 RepID=UPI000EF7541C|nr:cohesin domain-containing protein [Natronorubrum halophilum]
MIDTNATKRLLVCTMVVVLAATTMVAGAHATTADERSHGELTTTAADDRLTLEMTDSGDDTVTVTVSSTVADTAGFQANLSYAPSDADVESVEFEELGGVNQYAHDSDTGHVFLTQSTVGSESVDEPTLATVTFTVDEELTGLEFVDDDSLVTDGDGDVIGETDESSESGSSESGSSPGGSGSGGLDDESAGEANAAGADENDGDEADDENDTDGNGDDETDTDDETGSSDDSNGDETGTDDETNSSDDSSDDNEVNSSDDDSDGLPGFGAAITAVALLAVLGTCLRSRRD